ncbi:tRNA (adenosine(37)-N6)-threonylcarbamoyltransferase complex dimerization subunit type 1 TsaB [Rhodococcus sp. G-MC3]|uniref:tRNA (adenosine(37)-N6)-threonylcarbamoyltransferase complex dimerization subunit type 1 TsaB n=1 Tax=Rhodococcus sp. G-MC3 TaxID=3046209 RepID=UPI0024BAE96D|nr:tRNA (adenosine(37)-N6)-threonylcarbamoyltransferase complex dimerization subunit type 1 TsaB [Rhodococcus sp. G-MC3]MDJ0392711.1 tRNA (adenosine(37)-N6)-threonylcarbamoyltransferase complex dimerization subunit type 1 TsaB [Rhodococcus sp. G-MC3]
MFVLAVDTSTPAVTAGVVRFACDSPERSEQEVLASRVVVDARLHAEILTPNIVECLTDAGLTASDLDAVVVGVGPGPFTGLRVGMATAAAFGDALGIPVHGVCSLDAIAAELPSGSETLVVTDARRREVYWARYRDGVRIAGPDVCAPDQVDAGDATASAGSPAHAALFELPVLGVVSPSPGGLVSAARDALASGVIPDPLVPLYLRRPDAKTIEERAAAKKAGS